MVLWLFLVGVLLPDGASAAECTDTWKGPTGGACKTPANWSTGKVPSSTDVACLGTGTSVKIAGTEATVAMVQSEGTITTETSGYLVTLGTAEASSVRNLVLSAGGARPSGLLNVTEALTWGGGSIAGAGSVVIAPGATGVANGASPVWGRLVNRGSLNVTRIKMYENAEVVNEETMTVNAENLSGVEAIINFGKPHETPKIVNLGLIQKTAKSTAEGTRIEPEIENFGTVRSTSGNLIFTGGSPESTGSWEGLEGGMIAFQGATSSYSQRGGSWVGQIKVNGLNSSPGVKLESLNAEAAEPTLAGGTLAVAGGTVTLPTLDLTGGKTGGPGTLAISKSLTWSGGTLASEVVILHGASAVSTGLNDYINGPVVNRGTLEVPWGMISMYWTSELVNQGTLIVNSEEERFPAIHLAVGSTAPRIINEATFKKTSGTGTTKIEVPVESVAGTIKAATGKLGIENPIRVKASTATSHHACSGEPVDCGTGNFTETQSDFQIGSRGVGLDLTRTYSAQAADSLGIFGYGWTNSFGEKLTSEESGVKETLTDALGGTTTFTKSGATWNAPSWSADLLTGSTESGFTLTLRDQTKETLNGSGRLESVTDRNGNATTLAYNGSGKLETITDPSSRKITLTYNGEGLVEKAKDPMGHEVNYTYESKQLKSVTLPGEASPNWQFKYDPSHRMTSLADARRQNYQRIRLLQSGDRPDRSGGTQTDLGICAVPHDDQQPSHRRGD